MQKLESLADEHPPTEEEIVVGELLWKHFQLNHKLKKSDIIVCLGSNDTLPAERAADLYLDGWSNYPYLVFTGRGGRFQEDCKTTQAKILAETALKMGVPEKEILLEERADNTGDNYRFTKEELEKKGIFPKSLISVHMPSAEKRDWGTVRKVWPEVDVTIASPRVPMREYHIKGFRGIKGQEFSLFRVISTLVANYQRCEIYARQGFMIEQPGLLSPEVKTAYNSLIERGYTKDMLKDSEGKIIEV